MPSEQYIGWCISVIGNVWLKDELELYMATNSSSVRHPLLILKRYEENESGTSMPYPDKRKKGLACCHIRKNWDVTILWGLHLSSCLAYLRCPQTMIVTRVHIMCAGRSSFPLVLSVHCKNLPDRSVRVLAHAEAPWHFTYETESHMLLKSLNPSRNKLYILFSYLSFIPCSAFMYLLST